MTGEEEFCTTGEADRSTASAGEKSAFRSRSSMLLGRFVRDDERRCDLFDQGRGIVIVIAFLSLSTWTAPPLVSLAKTLSTSLPGSGEVLTRVL